MNMYSFEAFVEGVKYTVYFFASFTGMMQPFTPEDPLAADEIYYGVDKYGSTMYVQGWYTQVDASPRLDILKKISLIAEPIELDIELANTPGSYFHRLGKKEGKIIVGAKISALEAIHEKHYLRYVVDSKGCVKNIKHIFSLVEDEYHYKYDKRGKLIDKKTLFHDVPDKIPEF